MATKKVVQETVKTEDAEKVENVVKYIDVKPNWNNTKTWLHLCEQILGNFSNVPKLKAFKAISAMKTDIEKFVAYGNIADSEINSLEEKIKTLKSISEVAHYEVFLLKEKEGKEHEA